MNEKEKHELDEYKKMVKRVNDQWEMTQRCQHGNIFGACKLCTKKYEDENKA